MFGFDNAKKERSATAEMAEARASLYDIMVKILNQLPDEELLNKIEERVFEEMFHGFSGVDHIKSYCSKIAGNSTEEILTELSVDRTRILRGTGPKELKPPYEGCYKEDCDVGSAALKVKSCYRAAGMIPDKTVTESPDYLCVELDFMKNLCLREKEQLLSGNGVAETHKMQEFFLTEHLGSWVGRFCSATKEHAMTDFYRGFCEIFNAAIEMDMKYLQGLKID
ncbi:MAG: molecular chaperone TorD family protein [Deltaproteobacteria bacterium]|nr:molecular chaperone TorD family protein [Deltaproteobacteria bacterium]